MGPRPDILLGADDHADAADPNRHIEEIPEDPFKIPERFHHYDRYAQDLSLLRFSGSTWTPASPAMPFRRPTPFRGNEIGRPEIYAWGFRNPFRISFDRSGNGDLFVSGVAKLFWEAIYLVDRPGNYGWAILEGTHCYDRARAFDPPDDCPQHGPLAEVMQEPIVEYPNWSAKRAEAKVEPEPTGTATVGGFIYPGPALPELAT